jgi:hypothetical protein
MILDFINTLTQWFVQHPWIVWLMMGLSLLTVLASFVIVPWVIVRMPADHFAHVRPTRTARETLRPGARIAALLVKNILGFVLLLAGIILALPLVPGAGILTILLGLALLDLPGKRRLERWIVARPAVFAALNKLRVKHGRPPLDKPQ